MKIKETTKFVFALFITWRIWITVFAIFATLFVPLKSQMFFGGGFDNYITNPFLWGWANFDGEHYLTIASAGYSSFLYFFFPVYPDLIRRFSEFFVGEGRFLYSGILISNLAFLGALFVFWRLIRIDFKKEIATLTLLALTLFPTSFYFGAVYTESIFFLVAVSSFYFARKGNFFLAGILAAAASATRLVGVFLFPALLIEWWSQRNEKKINNKSLLGVLIAPLGLLLYMNYLDQKTGDPLYFYHQISHFGQQRSGDFILLYQVFYRYVKMIITVTKTDPLYFTILIEAASGLAGILLIVWAYLKKMRPSYLFFAFASYILPTLTGSFSSLPRYLLPIFPIYIALGIFLSERSKRFKVAFFVVSFLLLAAETILFLRGYWVA